MIGRVDHDRLAADFCELVRATLTSAELAAVNVRNTSPDYDGCDALHDYCDANELMDDALARQGLSLLEVAPEINRTWTRCRAACYQLRHVLVACEFSGTVRDAIAQHGHNVISCDLLPTESPGKHYAGDVRDILHDGWTDLISFPDCTYLCGSGAKHRKDSPERWAKTEEALEFFDTLDTAPIQRRATENSVGIISTLRRKPDQIIQPFDFGEDCSKRTCLWLHGYPPLVTDPADHVPPRVITYRGKKVKRWANQSPCGADATAPGPDRWKIRARTKPGIAAAMAAQWFNTFTLAAI